MREIPLSPESTVAVVAIATAVWCCDFLCLLCSFRAVHSAIPWHGVLLAYGVAQIVASFPVVPGGLGIVEGSLAVVLVAYGAGRVPAVSAALAFRVVNFWLAIAVGWLSVGVIAHRSRRAVAGRAGQSAQPPDHTKRSGGRAGHPTLADVQPSLATPPADGRQGGTQAP
jgi:uncharacterized protein (TIRG00374 family)